MASKGTSILLMLGAVFFFTVMDAVAKNLTIEIGLIPTLWTRYAGQAILVFIIIFPKLAETVKSEHIGLQIIRSIALMGATSFFFLGISKIGLAEATAIMDVNPVLITLGAFLFLGEKLGPRRIIGILVSLFGALIIIRPGTEIFTVYSIFPLMAAFCYSTYSLTTRYVGNKESPWTSLLYTALLGAIVFSVIVPFYRQPISLPSGFLMILLILCGTISHFMLIKALAIGEASLLAPFAYSGLLFATIWGFLFFGELPDRWSIIGGILIAFAGFYVWYRDIHARKKI